MQRRLVPRCRAALSPASSQMPASVCALHAPYVGRIITRNSNATKMSAPTKQRLSAHLCPAQRGKNGRAGILGWSSPPRLSSRPPRSRLPQFLRRSRARKTWTTSFWRLSTRAAAPTSTSRVATRSPPSPVPPACRLPHQSLSPGQPMPCLGPLCPFVPLVTTYLVAMLQPLVHITSAAELIAHPPHLPLGGPAMRSSSAHHRCVERACRWA